MGQYYLRARFYNPVTGRFLQEDVYRGDGLNLYAYCANNPVYYEDPSGHWCDKKEKVFKDLMKERGITEADLANDPELKLRMMAEASNIVKEQKRNSSNPSANQPNSDPRYKASIYYTYKELKKILKNMGASQYFEAHHLLEKQFAARFGVKKNDILSVALTKLWHRAEGAKKTGGLGVNIDNRINKALSRITGMDYKNAKKNATLQQIWQAHKEVYESIGQSDWAHVIYDVYVKPKGIQY